MSATHTPTLNAGGFENGGFAYLLIGNGRKAKKVSAAEAVSAINSHAALVAALESAKWRLSDTLACIPAGFVDLRQKVTQEIIDAGAALKAAKEKV